MIVQKLDKPVSAWVTTLPQSYSTPHTQQPEKLTETQISINFLLPSWEIIHYILIITKIEIGMAESSLPFAKLSSF